jgi:hypothetical protein
MWQTLVLAYQMDVWGSFDGRTARMCGKAAMAEPWKGVSKATMVASHKAQEGLLVG